MKKEELANRLVNKSIEAFLMGLEVFNKPTINYRTEGFAFFVNKWMGIDAKSRIIKTWTLYLLQEPAR